MGCIYKRDNLLWLKFKDNEGKWRQRSSGVRVGKEKEALKLLGEIEALIREGVKVGDTGPLTVRTWSERWLESRRVKDLTIIDDYEARLNNHILPKLGKLHLDKVRPDHIEDLVADLKAKNLAPRTVRHIYFQTHAVFERAVRKHVLAANPCQLAEDDLPPKIDKDPEWRQTAIYSRAEVEQILVEERIPWDRRMYDSLLFLAGIRFGEASALRWRHYDQTMRPLGRLTIARSYSTKHKIEKSVKTKVPRAVPVHPVLAALLAEWKLSGWPALFGRPPGPDDLIVPSRLGKNRSVNHMLKKFHQDLERIEIRTRRQHDLRRTFISLCLGDGASKDILRWITHAPEGDVMDDYTTLVWNPLCREVSKLDISLRRAQLAAATASNLDGTGAATRAPTVDGPRDGCTDGQVTVRVTPRPQALTSDAELAEMVLEMVGDALRGGRDLNPRPPA